MAEFQRWERQLLPQGGLVAPQTGPSLAESFGQGFADLANTAATTVESMRKTDEWHEERQWDIDQPKAAALVNKLQLQLAEQLPELKAQAATGLADYPDKIDSAITRATEDGLKGNPDPRFQRYVRGYMDEFRVSSVASGIKERTAASLALDAKAVQELVDGQSALVIKDFASFDTAARLVDDTIYKNKHFTADQKSELSRISKRSIALAGLNGLLDRDPDAALNELNSGKLEGIVTPEDQQSLLGDIKAERDRRSILAQDKADRELATSRGIAQGLYDSALQRAWDEGTYDATVRDKVLKAFRQESPAMLAKLDNMRLMGQDRISIRVQSQNSDSRLLKTLSNAADRSRDPLAMERFESAKRLIDFKRAAVKYDPAGYVLTVNSDVKSAWQTVADRPDDNSSVKQAFAITQQALLKLGLPSSKMRPIPGEVSDRILNWVKSDGGVQAIASLQKSFGKEGYPYLIAALAPKAGRYFTTALMLDKPEQQRAQAGLLEMSRNPDLKIKVLDNRLRGDEAPVRRAIADSIGDYAPAFNGSDERRQAFGNIFESAVGLTLYYMSGEHPVELDKAAALAANDLLRDHYSVGGAANRTFLVPKPYDAGEVAFALGRFLDDLGYQTLDEPSDGPETPNDTLVTSLQQTGRWSLAPDESGLELQFQGGQPAKIGGKKITLRWTDIAAINDDWKQRTTYPGGIIRP